MFLHRALVSGWWFLWEWAGGVQSVHAVHGALEEGLRVVDGADGSGQGRRGATVALVHPGSVAHIIQLHLPGQVAVGPVVQVLHAVGHLCVSLRGLLMFRSEQCRQLVDTCWRDDYKEWMT